MVGLSDRKLVQEQASLAGFRLEEAAVKLLVQWLQNGADGEAQLQALFNAVDTGGSIKVTADQVKAALQAMFGATQEQDFIQVISAFEVPKLLYDPVRKCFYRAETAPKLLGEAQDKMDLYINRFYLVHQRLRRRKGWYRPAIVDASSDSFVELTELKAMLGVVGETRIVMGCITQTEDGRYSIEDLSASLPLDLSAADVGHGFFTENSIVVAEGQLQLNGTFQVAALGLPPVESREDSLKAAKGLDFFGGAPLKAEELLRAAQWEADNEADAVVVLAGVWLDKPETLDRLRTVFAGFEGAEVLPKLFVLMGNFTSDAGGGAGVGVAAIRENFNALAALLRTFSRVREEGRILFVPGPDDPGPSSALPRPPLPKFLTAHLAEEMPGAVFGSNPCRVRHGTQELVFFRDDTEKCMRRQSLMPPPGDNSPVEAFRELSMTLLQQSHLAPVPLEAKPVYWQHDHALALYPLPHLLVIADASASLVSTSFAECQCLNPGSFSAAGTFAAYMPAMREVEECDVPEDA